MWPFRKKPTLRENLQARIDAEVQRAQEDLMRRLKAVHEQIDAEHDRKIAAMQSIASAPIRGFTWTPVINDYGQIVALAWKNDYDSAWRLLTEPAEGRA